MTNRTIKGVLDEAGVDGAVDADAHLALRVELDQLETDANRYRIFRMIACEPDKARQARMADAMDALMPLDPDEMPTPEKVDAMFDRMLIAVSEARDAQ